MSEEITMIGNTCANCHFQVIEHLKASSPKCSECFKNGTKINQFPNWQKVER